MLLTCSLTEVRKLGNQSVLSVGILQPSYVTRWLFVVDDCVFPLYFCIYIEECLVVCLHITYTPHVCSIVLRSVRGQYSHLTRVWGGDTFKLVVCATCIIFIKTF